MSHYYKYIIPIVLVKLSIFFIIACNTDDFDQKNDAMQFYVDTSLLANSIYLENSNISLRPPVDWVSISNDEMEHLSKTIQEGENIFQINLKNAYIERQKRNTFIDRGTKIRQILNTLDKDGGLSEDNSVLKLLIKNKDIEKLVKYLKGEISFNDYDIRDSNKLSEIKRKVTERGVEQSLRLFKNEWKDSDVRQTMM